MPQVVLDPFNPITTVPRAVHDYIVNHLDASLVTVQSEFPIVTEWKVPLAKAIVHIAQDDIDTRRIGFGTTSETYDPPTQMVAVEEGAALYTFNFDIGIWVFANMGGGSTRMVLHQDLAKLFDPPSARELFRVTTNVQVVNFTGGANIIDQVNGVPVWRTTGLTLVVRVIGAYVVGAFDAVTGFIQDPTYVVE
jgi:hypothetical protein